MARLSDSGYRCVLVSATGGEAGDILNPAMDRPEVREQLAQHRHMELERAARIIGYDEVIRLGYRDSGMPGSADNARQEAFVNAPIEQVLLRVVEIVRKERPVVVFGYDSHERYLHPDHLKVHELSTAVVEAAADGDWHPAAGQPWKIPLVVAPTFTVRRGRALHDAMESRGLESPLVARLEKMPAADRDAAGRVRVNVAGYIDRGRSALRAHATQIDLDGRWFAVPLDVAESAYPFEDYVVLSGREVAIGAAGLFEQW